MSFQKDEWDCNLTCKICFRPSDGCDTTGTSVELKLKRQILKSAMAELNSQGRHRALKWLQR